MEPLNDSADKPGRSIWAACRLHPYIGHRSLRSSLRLLHVRGCSIRTPFPAVDPEEIVRIGAAFVALGVRKIRITGGEPLTRKKCHSGIRTAGRIDQLRSDPHHQRHPAAPLRRCTAQRRCEADQHQHRLTATHTFSSHYPQWDITKTLAGIDAAIAAGFEPIKLNAVILKTATTTRC